MKKLFSLILALCFLLPTFLVFVGAEEDNNIYKQQALNIGINEHIDVDDYIDKAGTVYQDFSLIYISEPYYDFELECFLYTFYFYNPSLITLSSDFYSDDSLGNLYFSSVNFDYEDNIDVPLHLDIDLYENNLVFYESEMELVDCMFFKLDAYIEFCNLENIDLSHGSDNLHFDYIDFGYDEIGLLSVDYYTSFFDIEKYIQYTSPISDLSYFWRDPSIDFQDDYPIDASADINDCRLLFTYEVGTELYIYLYYPCNKKIYSSINYIYDLTAQKYKLFTFYPVKSDGAVVKLKCDVSSLALTCSVRDYYLLSSCNVLDYTKNSYPEYKAHYTFSENSLEGVEAPSFRYETTFSPTNFVDQQKYQLLITSDAFSPDDFEFICDWPAWSEDILDITGPVVGKYLVENEKNLLEFVVLGNHEKIDFTFQFSTDFPLLNTVKYYPEFFVEKLTSAAALSADTGEDIEASSGTVAVPEYDCSYKCNSLAGIDYSSSATDNVEASDNGTENGKTLYLRANQEEQIIIKPGCTWYRLNSSSTGLNYYQTLSSFYFSVPAEYLEMDDINIFNDRYISALELEYSSAMTTPIIVTSNKEVYDYLVEYKGEDLDYKISSDTYESFTNTSLEGNSHTYYDYDLLIGAASDSIIGKYSYSYSSDNYFDKYYYVIYNPDEFVPMQEVFSSDETLQLIKNDLHLQTELDYSHFVLNFYDEMTISSFKDKPFIELPEQLGLLNGIFFKIFGTTQVIDETKSFDAIELLYPGEIAAALNLDDSMFSSTYGVNINDVPSIKDSMKAAASKGEAFVLVRFDVFDYYADYCDVEGFSGDAYEDQSFFSLTKYYQNIDVLNLSATNNIDTKIYTVSCEPFDFVPGVTVPDPLDPDKILKPSNPDFWGDKNPWWDSIMSVVSLVLGCLAVVVLWPVISWFVGLIMDFVSWIAKKFKKKE